MECARAAFEDAAWPIQFERENLAGSCNGRARVGNHERRVFREYSASIGAQVVRQSYSV